MPDSPAAPAEGTLAAPAAARVPRLARVLLSPWSRFGFLLVLLAGLGIAVLLLHPQRLLSEGWPQQLTGLLALLLFTCGYALCAVAFVPRPLMSMAAGLLFGSALGSVAAVAGSVVCAGATFALGRLLGRDALRPLLRGKWLTGLDRQLDRHGFRTVLASRIIPGVPFLAANYCASVSRVRWVPFLLATGLGIIPNTAAYVVAGARSSSPGSPVFLLATGFIAVTAVAGVVGAWVVRRRGRRPRQAG